jgi:hypothetical protein
MVLGSYLMSMELWPNPILSFFFLLAGSSNRWAWGMNILLLDSMWEERVELPLTGEMVKWLFFRGLKFISPMVLNLSCRKNRGSKLSSLALMYLKLTHPTYRSSLSYRNIFSILTLSPNCDPLISELLSWRTRLVDPRPTWTVRFSSASKTMAEIVSLFTEGCVCRICMTSCDRY